MAHMRQTRSDFSLGFLLQVLSYFIQDGRCASCIFRICEWFFTWVKVEWSFT